MKRYFLLVCLAAATSFAVILPACKKTDSLFIPPTVSDFLSGKSGNYVITSPTTTYKIPIGSTTVSSTERVINISVTSPTGAVQGTHFNVPTRFVIPAGKAMDTLVVQGVYNQYLAGRKDTLVFKIEQEGGTASDINTTFTLAMRGPCSETEISSSYTTLAGTYSTLETAFNANGSTAYANSGPYSTVVKNVTLTSPTTIDITVTNIYGVSGWEAKFTLDFSDINTRKITTTSQRLGSGTPLGLAAYDIYVEPPSATQNLPSYGDFSFCQNAVNLKFRLSARTPSTGVIAGFITEQSGAGTATYVMAMKK